MSAKQMRKMFTLAVVCAGSLGISSRASAETPASAVQDRTVAVVSADREQRPVQAAANSVETRVAIRWTAEACKNRPLDFVKHVTAEVQAELKAKRAAEKELADSIAGLSAECRRIAALRVAAWQKACQFRARLDAGKFPFNCDGEDYPTPAVVQEQVSLLLAEVAGFDSTLCDLKRTRRDAGRDREQLVVDINDLSARLVQLEVEHDRLVAQAIPNVSRQSIVQLASVLRSMGDKPTEHEQFVRQFLAGEGTCPVSTSVSQIEVITKTKKRGTVCATTQVQGQTVGTVQSAPAAPQQQQAPKRDRTSERRDVAID